MRQGLQHLLQDRDAGREAGQAAPGAPLLADEDEDPTWPSTMTTTVTLEQSWGSCDTSSFPPPWSRGPAPHLAGLPCHQWPQPEDDKKMLGA